MNQHRRYLRLAGFILLVLLSVAAAKRATTPGPPHHTLSVSLDPAAGIARFGDTLTLNPKGTPGSVLHLHLGEGVTLESAKAKGRAGYSVRDSREKDGSLKLHVQKPGGEPWPEELTLEVHYTMAMPGGGETWALAAGDGFYPSPASSGEDGPWLTFELTAQAPQPWTVVSQGEKLELAVGAGEVRWLSKEPMQEIFLIADRYVETREEHGRVALHTFLRDNEPELARRYLDAAKQYLDFYSKLLGPYPYRKFALVENSSETGYGMPSFTLLGSTVIRFPFILHTSYPHEILHNWWGNGVYVKGGNWSEGLTAYLADHLLAELAGRDDAYRFEELKKYLSYVNPDNDFPLTEFRAREDMATQAVGYGKTLMLFHMLRREVGDGVFLQALNTFYQDNRFRLAGFEEIRMAFEAASGKNLSGFFKQWVERTGAPELALASAATVPSGIGHELKLEVRQTQAGEAYQLLVPVALWISGSDIPHVRDLRLKEKSQTFTLNLPFEPTAVVLDPYHDVFRKLGRKEVPPSLADTYGAVRPAAILPLKEAFPDVLLGYHQFAQAQDAPGPLVDDGPESPFPPGSLWVFGRENRYALKHLAESLGEFGVTFGEEQVTIAGETFPWKDHSFVFTVARPGGRPGAVTWIVAGSGESAARLARKLPHYGKYGYLVFAGPEATNTLKGNWRVSETDLAKNFDASRHKLPPRPPLVDFKP